MRYSSLHTCWQLSRNKPSGNLFLNIEPDARATLRLFSQLCVKHGNVLIKSCENSLIFGVIFKMGDIFVEAATRKVDFVLILAWLILLLLLEQVK